jgi:hypothetical protein
LQDQRYYQHSSVLRLQLSDLAPTAQTTHANDTINPHKPIIEGHVEEDENDHVKYSLTWWIDIIIALTCLVISGFMSGLTIGLASIDHLNLEIAAK